MYSASGQKWAKCDGSEQRKLADQLDGNSLPLSEIERTSPSSKVQKLTSQQYNEEVADVFLPSWTLQEYNYMKVGTECQKQNLHAEQRT